MVMRVAVIGSGGMGSWFARFFRSRGDVITVSDRDQRRARRLATRIGARCARDNSEAARGSDVVVLATSVNSVSRVIKEIAPALKRNALLFDICATKSGVIPALRSVQRRGVKIASIHPMFGPFASGVTSRVIIVVRTGKDMRGAEMIKRMFRGARILLVDPEVHDKWMALTLALPHFLNMAFAAAVSRARSPAEARKFAGRTFNLQMLLAETVAVEPETTADIQITNREFVVVLRKLLQDIRSLARIVNARDRAELVARYKRIRALLSKDPEFGVARKEFEKICAASSTISRR